MRAERRAALAAFQRYLAAAKPPAALVHELLDATARMVAADTAREMSFIADGLLITRQPITRR